MNSTEVLAIVGGVLFLRLYFLAVSIRWPESYYRLGSTLENIIASGPGRYVAFRFLPVFVTSLFLAVTVDRAGGRPGLVGVVVAAVHLAGTTGKAAVLVLAGRRFQSRRLPLLLAYTAVTAGVLLAAGLPLALRNQLEGLVPRTQELSSTLWTAALAGVAGAYVVQLSVHRGERVARSIKLSKGKIDERLWHLALQEARRHGVSPDVVFAFMVVENLQRPAWFRRLENALGRFWGKGTYGILQVPAEGPIADEESIIRFVRDRLAPFPEMQERHQEDGYGYYGPPEAEAVRRVALNHNRDGEYADSVVEALEFIIQDPPIDVPQLR